MLNKIKFSIALLLTRRKFIRQVEFDKNKLEKAKKLFLARYKEKFPQTKKGILSNGSYHNEKFWIYTFSYVIVIVCFFGISLILANKEDIMPNEPLYLLKRIGEDVTVQFIPEEGQAKFHNELAQRRLEEIRVLETKKVKMKEHNKKINKLKNDSNEAIYSALDKIDDMNNPNKDDEEDRAEKEEICDSIEETIADYEKTTADCSNFLDFDNICNIQLEGLERENLDKEDETMEIDLDLDLDEKETINDSNCCEDLSN